MIATPPRLDIHCHLRELIALDHGNVHLEIPIQENEAKYNTSQQILKLS